MLGIINSWQFYVAGYLVFVVIFYQFYKLAVRNAKRDGAATVLLQLVAGLSLLLFIPLFHFSFPKSIYTYLLLAGACIFYALNDRLQTTARKHLQVSVFSIIGQLSNVFLIVYGLTLFREQIVMTKILGAGLILCGNIFLLYRGGKFTINKYTIIGILLHYFLLPQYQ